MDIGKIDDLPDEQKEEVIEMEFKRLFEEVRKELNAKLKELQG